MISAISLEREKELQLQQNGKEENGPAFKNNYFKPNCMRNNYLSGQQVSPTHRGSLPTTPTEYSIDFRKQTGKKPENDSKVTNPS